jgi:23S rRNA (cytosine1962-C5)-methyltransferase
VDVFGDHAVIQITTFGMDRRREALVAAIRELLAPACVIERSDLPVRALEGLAETKGVLFGEPRLPCRVEEDGAVMLADLLEGQKTGYYLDQTANRALFKRLAAGRGVLDLFCYVGAWSLTALAGGADSALAIDSSAPALKLAEAALPMNPAAQGRVVFEKADVFARVRALTAEARRFDAVVLDPPPLARGKRDAREALKAYRELNHRAMLLLAPGGLLVTCCCSHAIDEEEFVQVVGMAARDARCDLTLVARPTQPIDHPVHLQTPETHYLKTLFLAKRDW